MLAVADLILMATYRTEHDLLGTRDIPAEALHGIYTERALEKFPFASDCPLEILGLLSEEKK